MGESKHEIKEKHERFSYFPALISNKQEGDHKGGRSNGKGRVCMVAGRSTHQCPKHGKKIVLPMEKSLDIAEALHP